MNEESQAAQSHYFYHLINLLFLMKRPTDTQRLNWLQKMNACLRFDAEDDASLPQAVVFLPTIKDGESTWEAAGHGDTFREAIDDAIKHENAAPCCR